MQLVIARDPEAVARQAAELAVDIAGRCIERRGVFTLALSGGSTPRLFHRALVERKDELDWSKTHVLFSDERAVPPDHDHSNYRMAVETLLSQVPIPEVNVHRIVADDGETGRAAAEYESVVRELAEGGVDLVMLGMGDDGHTASLFEGREPTGPGWVLPATAPEESPVERRVTFSYDAIANARNVAFLITSEKKAARLAEVLGGPGELPTQKVLGARDTNTYVLVDEGAASLLEGRNG